MDLRGFDARTVEPNDGDFTPIPEGWYTVRITHTEQKTNKGGTGSHLAITFEVIGGEHEGRRVRDLLNLDNPNPNTVNIARGQLSAICRAIGVMTPDSSEDLHGIPLIVRVTQRAGQANPDGTGGQIYNDVKGYKAVPTAKPADDCPV